ncbi:hypothetical protein ACFQ73_02055 [Amycolatopsis japonica]|uniref:hypothetical protein n=1 Tax=Amycolatopsis japonica TaxID=208439 RepID=UPI00367021C0
MLEHAQFRHGKSLDGDRRLLTGVAFWSQFATFRVDVEVTSERRVGMGLEVVVGFLIAWAVGKARRAGQQLDGVADQVVDASAERLRNVVLRKLGMDPAVERLQLEAGQPEGVSDRTQQRVTLALEDAVEQDTSFAAELKSALADAEKNGVVAMSSGAVVSGPVTASGHGIAIGVVGRDATIGQAPDPHRPDRA